MDWIAWEVQRLAWPILHIGSLKNILGFQSGEEKLDNCLNEEVYKRVLMEVTKRVNNIMEDAKLKKKLVSSNVDDEFSERISR